MQTTKRRTAETWRAMVARFVESGLTEEFYTAGHMRNLGKLSVVLVNVTLYRLKK
jgi:hypothetical protein